MNIYHSLTVCYHLNFTSKKFHQKNKKIINMTDIDIYTEYYLNQFGTGIGGIYTGPAYQKGYGIGSFLGGLFRTVYPLLSKGTKAIGSEFLKSGVELLSDLTREDPNTALKKRG